MRAAHWQRPGPHSAQETIGWHPAEHAPLPRQPAQAASLEQVKAIFDGYDTGIRFADDMLGRLVAKLDELGVRDETAIWVTSDHGEQFGELGVYCDHMAADEATAHIPGVLRWPGLGPAVDDGLHYHVDVAATVLELAGLRVPPRVGRDRLCRRAPRRCAERARHARAVAGGVDLPALRAHA